MVLEPGVDALVTSIESFSLVGGLQEVLLASGSSAQSFFAEKTRVTFGIPSTYFVVVELENDAADHGIASFQVTHAAEAGSAAIDFDFHEPLALEAVPNVASGVIVIVNG